MPRLQKRIAEIRERVGQLEPILKRQALLLAGLIDDSFQNSRSPTGEAWAPLAAATVADTAQLRMATTAIARGSKIVFGTSGAPATYGVFHVTGTKNMPRRSYLPVSANGKPDFSSGPAADWLKQTEERVVNYLNKGENQR